MIFQVATFSTATPWRVRVCLYCGNKPDATRAETQFYITRSWIRSCTNICRKCCLFVAGLLPSHEVKRRKWLDSPGERVPFNPTLQQARKIAKLRQLARHADLMKHRAKLRKLATRTRRAAKRRFKAASRGST